MGLHQRIFDAVFRTYRGQAVDWLSREENRKRASKLLGLSLQAHGYNNYRSLEESGEVHLIESLGQINAIRLCLDIGANTGDYSRCLLRAGAAFVHAYEPHPLHDDALAAIRVDYPDRFQFHTKAVAATEGSAELRFNRSALSHASLSEEVESISYVENTERVTVPVVTLAAEVERHGLVQIDFVKIDTEGFEDEVLAGAAEAFLQYPPVAIQLEFNLHQLMRGHSLLSLGKRMPDYKCFQLLRGSAGLRAVDTSAPDANVYHYSNFVFVREDVAPALLASSRELAA